MDINQEIQNQIDIAISKKLPSIIEEKVEKMMTSVIENIFSSYGDVAGKVKEKISSSLDISLQEFDIIDYNALVAQTINDSLSEQVNLSSLRELVAKTVGRVNKKEIHIQEIVDLVIEADKEYNDIEGEGKVTFLYEFHDRYEWYDIGIDAEEKDEIRDCDIKFTIHKDGTISSLEVRDKWNRERKGHISGQMLMSLRGIEHEVFRIYAARVKVDVSQIDHVYTGWDRYD